MPKRSATAKRPQTKPLGQLLRESRLAAGLSLRDLSRLTGIEPTQLSQIELGRRLDPQFSTVARIAQGIGVSLDGLSRRSGIGTRTAPADSVGPDARTRSALDAMSAIEGARRSVDRAAAEVSKMLPAPRGRSRR